MGSQPPPSSLRTQGPIRRGGCCLNDLVNGFASTITAGGYGSLLSQGRRWRCDKFNTTAAPGVALAKPGQITTSDFQNQCQALKSKILRFTILKNRIIAPPVSRPQEGRIMIVTTRGARDAVDALASGTFFRAGRKRQGVRRSRVVLAPRRWRQACGVFRK